MQPQYTPKDKSRQHRATEHHLYETWRSMKQRCSDPGHSSFANYGARGIEVCQEWRHDFWAFCHYVTSLPGYDENAKLSLDRIDNSGNYEPGNVRLATSKEQHRNTRRNQMITHNGETLCIVDWAERLDIKCATLYERIYMGWPMERVLTVPVKKKKKKSSR